METSLEVVLTEKNIAKENAARLIEAFGAPFTEAGEIIANYQELVVTDESQTALMKEAREKRLALKKVRTGVENKRKELKEDALRQGQAIDFVARYIKENIEPAEKHLELQEKFAEIQRAERAAKTLNERIMKLGVLTDDLTPYNLEAMSDEAYDKLLADLTAAKEARVAEEKRLEAERVAAEKARQEEQLRVMAENERLRKEAAEKEAEAAKQLAEERKKAEIERNRIEAENAKRVAAERAKADAERAEREKLEKEKLAREAEERARKDAEDKAKRAAEEAERQAILAPDKEKLMRFAEALELIRTTKLPAVKTKQAQEVLNYVDKRLVETNKTIKELAEKL